VIFTAAIRTKNKKIIMKEKKNIKVSEAIQENGDKFCLASKDSRLEGRSRESLKKIPKR
jgi:hypothetical protein